MKQARGIVTAVAEDAKAEVKILTDDTLSGCSSRTEHCHHCSEGTSSLVIKVSNKARAGAGDHVTVLFNSGAVLKSVLILVGIPMIGILAGTVLGTSLYGGSGASQGGAFLAGAACFGFAMALAFVTYKHWSEKLQPYIDQIIAHNPITQGTFDPVCGMEIDPLTVAAKINYEGRTYFFCKAGCLEAFIRDPSRYLVGAMEAQRCRGT